MKKTILSITILASLSCICFWVHRPKSQPAPLPLNTPTLVDNYLYNVSRYEITQKQYQLVMGNNPSHFKGDNLPVENVSWDEAIEFCRKLTLQERQRGNISENERYLLASSDFYERTASRKAWIKSNSNEQTQSVEKTFPSEAEFESDKNKIYYGVHGNVSEWVLERNESNGLRKRMGGNFKSEKRHDFRQSPLEVSSPKDYRGSDTGFRIQLYPILNNTSLMYDLVRNGLHEEAEEWLLYVRNLMWLAEDKDFGKRLIQIATDNKDEAILKLIHNAQAIPLYAIDGITDKYGIEMCKIPLPGNNGCFYMSKYEITEGEFEAVMGYERTRYYTVNGKREERFFNLGSNYPISEITWNEAMEFCKRLTELRQKSGFIPEDLVYTLPSEEEWLYACRAGLTTEFNTGGNTADYLEKAGWYNENSDSEIHPVGKKAPNQFGLYDMHGNLSEWIRSKYTEYDEFRMKNVDFHPFRGGSFRDIASDRRMNADCRHIHNTWLDGSFSTILDKGIRVVLIPKSQAEVKQLHSRSGYSF
ncbi:MAG: SUMF1/EgtB/PvdO family nonheme iron enzyme [Opitutales bacterium]|nr:SUMF1/EgtB/PvdO family nonheme iron enzyme [Opitutales bacterium]